jgi:hypothetical protein
MLKKTQDIYVVKEKEKEGVFFGYYDLMVKD